MNNKYHAKKKKVGNKVYDSGLEADFAVFLQSKGLVFIEQPEFTLQEGYKKNGKTIRPIIYKGDFQVASVVYDVKGVRTTDFNLKKKMFEYKFKDLTLICVTSLPKWIQELFKIKWINLDNKKKLDSIVSNFKKKNDIKVMSIKYANDELISNIQKKVIFIK